MPRASSQLLKGTVHVLILRTLADGPRHGFGVASHISERSSGVLEMDDGTLYQALHRMQERGWLDSEWRHAESGKRARFYWLTPEGRERLAIESESWRHYASAVTSVLQPASS